MRLYKNYVLIILAFISILTINAACSPVPTPTPTATYTPTPTATPTYTPTFTPTPTYTSTPTPTYTPTPKLTCIKFFYDGNMNRSKDENEPFLTITVKGYQQSQDGCYYVPEGEITLYISGKAPNGKDLLNATLDWPKGLNLLPSITVDTSKIKEIGLVDGFCSSPIMPKDLFEEEYKKFERDPGSWFDTYAKYYTNAKMPPNWLFYGYNKNWNKKGLYEHLAFDIWASDGTPVYAPVPGRVVYVDASGLYIAYQEGKRSLIILSHIKPIVKKGQFVEAGQLVGYVIGSEGNHVHMEFFSKPEQILYCFPGLGPNNLLINPTQGPYPVLPYFGR